MTEYETTPEAWESLLDAERRARRLFAESSLLRVADTSEDVSEAPNPSNPELFRIDFIA